MASKRSSSSSRCGPEAGRCRSRRRLAAARTHPWSELAHARHPSRCGQDDQREEPADYDELLIPGGFINPDLLRQSAEARAFVRAFSASGRPIVTLCHGPWILASAGLLKGRTLTSWPGIRDDVVNAGATWRDEPVVRDGNLTTSRGPQDMAVFVPAMLDAFTGTYPQPERTHVDDESDPQRDSPPALAVAALRWSPKPSAVAVAGIGLAMAARGAHRPAPRG